LLRKIDIRLRFNGITISFIEVSNLVNENINQRTNVEIINIIADLIIKINILNGELDKFLMDFTKSEIGASRLEILKKYQTVF
jgi:hypothetical protein